MELREKTKYVLGLPGGTQIGFDHGQKYPKDYDHQPAGPNLEKAVQHAWSLLELDKDVIFPIVGVSLSVIKVMEECFCRAKIGRPGLIAWISPEQWSVLHRVGVLCVLRLSRGNFNPLS